MRRVIRTGLGDGAEYPRFVRRGVGTTQPRKRGGDYATYLCRLLDLYLAKAVKKELFEELFEEYLEKVRLEELDRAERLEEYAARLEQDGRGDLACRLRLLLERRKEVAGLGQE